MYPANAKKLPERTAVTRNVWTVIAWAGALGAALWLAGPASAETLDNCRREYAARKAAGEAKGEREKKFIAAGRAGRATTAPGSLSEAKTGDKPPQGPIDKDEISKETENPVTRWITVPLRYEPEFDDGPYKLTKETFELDQAVAPFKLNDDWALITRTKLPLVVQPPKSTGADWETGLNNGYTTFFLSPERGQGFYWGVGPVLYYPATNTAIGVNKWGSGPSFAFIVKNDSPLTFGLVVNNIWSSGGGPDSDRTNQMLLNPFVSYHLGDGWAISSSPDITANWIASGGKWTVPVGGGVSKVIEVGGQSIKLALDAYYNAIRPKADQETWLMQFTLTFVFPR
jgi:hypothetical protein